MSPSRLAFHKLHGLGNDFVLLDLRSHPAEITGTLAARLADRRSGIGCDQVLVLRPARAPGQLAAFDIWNADGSTAEQCGNGVRCIGRYLEMRGETPAGPFRLGAPTREIRLEILAGGLVCADLGAPEFRPAPTRLTIAGQDFTLTALSLGNPHAVLQVDDAKSAPVASLGPAISTHTEFPQGCNVGFAQLLDRDSIRLRVYERGAGETPACGTGACAAAVAMIRMGLANSRVRVVQEGGELVVHWPGEGQPVTMTGPAVYVFEGTVFEGTEFEGTWI